ncbi:hypothetical protein AAEX28_15385 [Lentisphaerota bacterium WC36G]|nr:hypothetical protein LJT99_02145 [Lentisphaerae bacterium WC36]
MKTNILLNVFALFGFLLMLIGMGNLYYEYGDKIVSLPLNTIGGMIFLFCAIYQSKNKIK